MKNYIIEVSRTAEEDLENMIKDLRADQSVIDVFRITN